MAMYVTALSHPTGQPLSEGHNDSKRDRSGAAARLRAP
jgi:hypothetical protein